MVERYNPTAIEKKWQQQWEQDEIYRARDDDPRAEFYALTMFPYTSGDLHVGHWYAMAPSDTYARYKRMKGHNVMLPMGFDAFGLPAENAAIKRGIHPYTWTMENIERMRGQLKTMGAGFDWSREVITCLPDYYKWTQWFFTKMFEKGLVYRAKAPANWCPVDQTVLANEQVLPDGTCERCSTVVTKRDIEQWLGKITGYADELLDFSGLQWPDAVMAMQRNWIGKSYGTEIAFGIDAPGVSEKEIRVFTTRPDTVYGVTFMVLAPEHPLVPLLTTPDRRSEVEAYVEQSRRATEIERLSTEREKTGVFTGAYCKNLLSGEDVPVFIADYVLLSYGTGCVMAVPAHDQRDFEFAKKYGLPIKVVISPPDWQREEFTEAFVDLGIMINSGQFDGTPSEEGKQAVSEYIERQGWGRRTTIYRLRDWLISRQRYWGCPIPIVYCPDCGVVAVPEDQLPVLLPEDAEFKPTGESPLARHGGFVNTICPQCGKPAKRETDTIDTFLDSNWYFIRYASPHYNNGPVESVAAAKWLPVDQYTGGAEHAVMHLLYARFFWKVVRDLGLVSGDEPFIRLFNQGQILGPDGQRMSKSRGNVVAPDEQVAAYGADTFRAYLMFLGPWEDGGPFNLDGISGIWRWLNRVWNITQDHIESITSADESATRDLRRFTHKTIKRVTNDIERFRFNTALAALMEFTNHLYRATDAGPVDTEAWHEATDALLLLTAPLTPHIAEELWAHTGHPYSIHTQAWPEYDAELAREEEVTLVVQVNGRLRDRLTVPVDIGEEQAKQLALTSEKVQPHVGGASIERIVYVPGRLVNVVLR